MFGSNSNRCILYHVHVCTPATYRTLKVLLLYIYLQVRMSPSPIGPHWATIEIEATEFLSFLVFDCHVAFHFICSQESSAGEQQNKAAPPRIQKVHVQKCPISPFQRKSLVSQPCRPTCIRWDSTSQRNGCRFLDRRASKRFCGPVVHLPFFLTSWTSPPFAKTENASATKP